MSEKFEIVSEWRKGLAIGRYKTWSSASNSYKYVYVLLNENYEQLKLISLDYKGCIHRSIDGRYFATKMELYDPITYPRQDRDTTYLTTPIISYVLDENGDYIISAYNKGVEEVNKYIEEKPIKYNIELGEGLVLYANKTYDISSNTLHDFSPLEYIHKLQEQEYPRCDEYEHELKDYNFLRYLSSKNTRVNEDGEILCGSSVYGINKCDLLFTIPKQIEPLGKFENGVCKVGIVSDYRDFIVITSNAKIVKVYEYQHLGLIIDLFNATMRLRSQEDVNPNESIEIKYALPEGVKVHQVKTIEAEVEIEKYLLCFPSAYKYGGGFGVIRHNSKYGTQKLHIIHRFPEYFEDKNGLWYEITKENDSKIDEQVFDKELNRPNYIKDIELIASGIILNDRKYSIYKFECRPYGYITKDGSFNYNFDVDKIEW